MKQTIFWWIEISNVYKYIQQNCTRKRQRALERVRDEWTVCKMYYVICYVWIVCTHWRRIIIKMVSVWVWCASRASLSSEANTLHTCAREWANVCVCSHVLFGFAIVLRIFCIVFTLRDDFAHFAFQCIFLYFARFRTYSRRVRVCLCAFFYYYFRFLHIFFSSQP